MRRVQVKWREFAVLPGMKGNRFNVYTGNRMLVEVIFVMAGPIDGLQDGWVIMSTNEIERVSA